MNQRLLILVDAYLDGSLDGEGALELSRALRAGGAPRAIVRNAIAFAGEIGQALDEVDDASFLRGFDERMRAHSTSAAFAQEVERSLSARQPRPLTTAFRHHRRLRLMAPWLWAGAATIAFVLTCVMVENHRHHDEVLCTIDQGDGDVLRAGRHERGDRNLINEDLVIARSALVLHWNDRSRMELSAGGRLPLSTSPAGPLAVLDQGRLEAEVTHQGTGRTLTISTTSARIVVVGTHFVVTSDASGTRLEVLEGIVRFTRISDQSTLLVHAHEHAEARLPGAPIPAVAGPASAELAGTPWMPLFHDPDLTEWRQQHGQWTVTAGVVHGSDPLSHGEARLISRQSFGELELTCRMRIQEKEKAEIQVNDYTSYFEIPAAAAAGWRNIHLIVSGDSIRCTADGQDLICLHDVGYVGEPPGALGFYIMPGGALDIEDAKIRPYHIK